jgi:hypothetical protein
LQIFESTGGLVTWIASDCVHLPLVAEKVFFVLLGYRCISSIAPIVINGTKLNQTPKALRPQQFPKVKGVPLALR